MRTAALSVAGILYTAALFDLSLRYPLSKQATGFFYGIEAISAILHVGVYYRMAFKGFSYDHPCLVAALCAASYGGAFIALSPYAPTHAATLALQIVGIVHTVVGGAGLLFFVYQKKKEESSPKIENIDPAPLLPPGNFEDEVKV